MEDKFEDHMKNWKLTTNSQISERMRESVSMIIYYITRHAWDGNLLKVFQNQIGKLK